MKKILSVTTGFLILFLLYHAAEYMIVYRNSATGFFAFHAAFFFAAFLIAKWQFGKGLEAWGFKLNKHTAIQVLTGFVFGIFLYTTTFSISLWLGVERLEFVPAADKILPVLGLFVLGNIFASFSEDVLTRAYVATHLYGRVPVVLLAVISCSIYVLNHIYRLAEGLDTLLYLFLLGAVLLIPLIRTKQIWLTGSIHWASNCTFYLTHQVWKTSTGANTVSPNYVFAFVLVVFGVILLLIPQRLYTLISGSRQQAS